MGAVNAWNQVFLRGFAGVALLLFIGMVVFWIVLALTPGMGAVAWVFPIGLVLFATALVATTAALVRWFGGSWNETLFAGAIMLVVVDAISVLVWTGLALG